MGIMTWDRGQSSHLPSWRLSKIQYGSGESSVGTYLGLTPRRYQSGNVDWPEQYRHRRDQQRYPLHSPLRKCQISSEGLRVSSIGIARRGEPKFRNREQPALSAVAAMHLTTKTVKSLRRLMARASKLLPLIWDAQPCPPIWGMS
jgi:hypothetical protein